ncbi:MAG: carboxyltransferase domain-containing protein [Rhodospirillales bacterium]|nr:carboxyltransferase domain-containing protein [Rhodospirillales bacterium]
MTTRISFGGDEHIFVELDEEMSLEACFRALALTRAVRGSGIAGITEVCPANASFQVKFDPDVIAPDVLRARLEELEHAAEEAEPVLNTRIIEVPVFYNDPWTHETLMRFRERHQAPDMTDLEYAAKINNYPSVEALIAAHEGSPWFVSMVGFVAGLPWLYQMVERSKQIEVPKYLRPRTDTPKLTVGHGGCLCAIYSVRGAGGYQMFGITPMPIYDPQQQVSHLRDFMILFTPGDIVKFRGIDRVEYDAIQAEVEAGRYVPRIRPVTFSLDAFKADPAASNAKLVGALYGH